MLEKILEAVLTREGALVAIFAGAWIFERWQALKRQTRDDERQERQWTILEGIKNALLKEEK